MEKNGRFIELTKEDKTKVIVNVKLIKYVMKSVDSDNAYIQFDNDSELHVSIKYEDLKKLLM